MLSIFIVEIFWFLLFIKSSDNSPDDFDRVRIDNLGALLLRVEIEKIAYASHSQLVVFVFERREGVLEHVGRVSQIDEREEPLVHLVHVVGPLDQYRVLDFFNQLLLQCAIVQRVCGHIEQEEVLLFRTTYSLLHKALC